MNLYAVHIRTKPQERHCLFEFVIGLHFGVLFTSTRFARAKSRHWSISWTTRRPALEDASWNCSMPSETPLVLSRVAEDGVEPLRADEVLAVRLMTVAR